MNFWNDPSKNASKSVLLIAILALVGVGIYQFAGNNTSLTGNVYRGTKKNVQAPIVSNDVSLGIVYNNNGTCTLTTCAEGLTADGSIACVNYSGNTKTTKGEKTCDVAESELQKFTTNAQ